MLEDEKKEVERNEVQKEEEKEVVRKGIFERSGTTAKDKNRLADQVRGGGASGQGNNQIARCTASCEKPTDDAVGS